MKFKLHLIAWLLIIPLGIVSFIYSNANFRLNLLALQAVHPSFLNEKSISAISLPYSSDSTLFICHSKWLLIKNLNRKGSIAQNLTDLLECSYSYLDMVRNLVPTDVHLANRAHKLYPDLAEPLYWLAESKGGYTEPLNLSIYQQIVAEHPQEGLAWCYLGYQYEQAGDLRAALNARINCCYNGDPPVSNGCFHAGRLYEEMGDKENAIKFYLFSKWTPSQNKGRALLAESSK